MKCNEIRIRDPFILPFEGKYYLYGSSSNCEGITTENQFWCYVSDDLENWSEPILCFDPPSDFWGECNFWAPEVHIYNGKFYMFATFYAEGRNRATQALVSDSPKGPFREFGKPLTPDDWMCLDGTLYVENNIPYLVFCHEWLQVDDGEIAMVQLKQDLSEAVGEPKVLFKASESGWAHPLEEKNRKIFVTDGPWLVKEDETLIMFWSSFHNGSYAEGVAISASGKLAGPWTHSEQLLFEKDGGHGMMFESFEGKQYFALHQPNIEPYERPHFFEIEKIDGCYRLK